MLTTQLNRQSTWRHQRHAAINWRSLEKNFKVLSRGKVGTKKETNKKNWKTIFRYKTLDGALLHPVTSKISNLKWKPPNLLHTGGNIRSPLQFFVSIYPWIFRGINPDEFFWVEERPFRWVDWLIIKPDCTEKSQQAISWWKLFESHHCLGEDILRQHTKSGLSSW